MTESPDDAELDDLLDHHQGDAEAHQVARQAEALSAELWPLVAPRLAGRPPDVQSAVLADLTAIWLAGNVVPGDPAATTRLRADLFAHFVRVVGDLIRPNSMIFHGHE